MAHVRHSRPLFTPSRHWHREDRRLYWVPCCDRRAALGKMSDQGIDWSELKGDARQMPRKGQTGQTARMVCSCGAGVRRVGPGSRARGAMTCADRSDGSLTGSARRPVVLRVWWSGGQAVTRSSGVPGYRGSGSVIAYWPAGWGGPMGADPRGSRLERMPGCRAERGFGCRNRRDWGGAANPSRSAHRGPRRSRGHRNLATLSNNFITRSNISEFVRT
jgi:hypothetical protein